MYDWTYFLLSIACDVSFSRHWRWNVPVQARITAQFVDFADGYRVTTRYLNENGWNNTDLTKNKFFLKLFDWNHRNRHVKRLKRRDRQRLHPRMAALGLNNKTVESWTHFCCHEFDNRLTRFCHFLILFGIWSYDMRLLWYDLDSRCCFDPHSYSLRCYFELAASGLSNAIRVLSQDGNVLEVCCNHYHRAKGMILRDPGGANMA